MGDVIEMPAAPTREGYTFKYWKGSQYNPGDKYTVDGDHAFTAVWEENSKGGGTNTDTKDTGSSSATKGSSPKTRDALGATVASLAATAACALCLAAIAMLQNRRRTLKQAGKRTRR